MNLKKIKYIFFSLNITIFNAYSWSWLHTINTDNYMKSYENENVWQWTKAKLPQFSQLIFSFNAMRPTHGYLSFWIQVRDSLTKKWYNWHEAFQWGNKIQKSLDSQTKGTNYHYVRLEIPKNRLADGFRIQVKAHKGANIKNLKKISVNTTDHQKFNSEIGDSKLKNLSSVFIRSVPRRSQMILNHDDYASLCSPTSLTMLLNYLLKKDLDPCRVANGVYDYGLKVYGSWPFNISHAFELSDGKYYFHVEKLNSFKDLHSYLLKDIPVVVSIRGRIKGGAKPYPNGHLLVVIGYNKKHKKVLCHDPAFGSNKETFVAYNLNDFLAAWERSFRLAYIANACE